MKRDNDSDFNYGVIKIKILLTGNKNHKTLPLSIEVKGFLKFHPNFSNL